MEDNKKEITNGEAPRYGLLAVRRELYHELSSLKYTKLNGQSLARFVGFAIIEKLQKDGIITKREAQKLTDLVNWKDSGDKVK